MLKSITISIILITTSIIVGCSSTPPAIYADPSLNEDNAAILHFYRPASSAWMGMAIDYRVLVDNNYVGSLKGSKSISTFVKPGESKVAIHSYFGSKGNEDLAINVPLEEGKLYYFRFSQHIDDFIYAGPYYQKVTGHGELRLVSKSVWESKK